MKRFMATLGVAMMASSSMASIYDNGPANFFDGNEMTAWLQSEDFMLNGNAVANGATFCLLNTLVGSNNANWDGSLQWYIFNDSGGQPGAIHASGNAQNIVITFAGTINGFDHYGVAFDFGQNVALTGSTQYHLGLHMAADYNSRDELYWGTTNYNATQTGWESSGGTMNNWFNNGQEHCFTLVPTPSTAALLGLGGLAAVRRRR